MNRSTRIALLLWLAGVVLSGCAPVAQAFQLPATGQPTATSAPTTSPAPDKSACPVTEPVVDQPVKDPNADPFGEGEYYINPDRTLWTAAQNWTVGGHKTIWIRPQGTDLEVTGRRLDGDAPPMHIDVTCCYPTGFQVAGLFFPAGGCWEVVARAGESELQFIVWVEPAVAPPAEACASLEQAVKYSEMIVIGTVADTEVEGRYAWHTINVNKHLKPAGGITGYSISLLQDLEVEPALKSGSKFILFLEPGHWRILCPRRSLVEVQGEHGFPLGEDPFWEGGELEEYRKKIRG